VERRAARARRELHARLLAPMFSPVLTLGEASTFSSIGSRPESKTTRLVSLIARGAPRD
jgi:hypothetical protein